MEINQILWCWCDFTQTSELQHKYFNTNTVKMIRQWFKSAERMHVYANMCECACVCWCVSVSVCIYVCVCMCLYMCVCAYMCVFAPHPLSLRQLLLQPLVSFLPDLHHRRAAQPRQAFAQSAALLPFLSRQEAGLNGLRLQPWHAAEAQEKAAGKIAHQSPLQGRGSDVWSLVYLPLWLCRGVE